MLAAVALAGSVLLGGPGQAFADENDDASNSGMEFGNSAPADSDFGQGTSEAGQGASGFDQGASGFDQGASGFGQGGSGFGEGLDL
ncbi:hypothetical protein ACM01_03385 [Streptomyces viridochromogenes]|uniref:Secreted protein n=2 Tax=Streptomyces viridochromogenes TaxID=1938 RepID=A0A0J7ZLU1_STRVR|nr:hypothetical protein ACM01_03385 [Streptomyces viridochromogenes]KOG22052.1 hypothetical protein ADK36_14070 [Streptomyces viridochromogenes]KOG29959.1 hypothetical protein ADK35_01505 [Streptomyces viridochromogenes]